MEHASHANHQATDQDVAKLFLFRFYKTTILLIPLLLVSNIGVKFLGVPDFSNREYVGFGLSLIIAYFSLVFFEHAKHEIKSRQFGMMTLVSLAIASGLLFSITSTFLPYFGQMEFYLEISTLIWVLLFGHYLEAKSTAVAGNALREVAKLLPKQAHLIKEGNTKDVDINELKPGDIILVKPGEKLPADGTIIEGSAEVDEALVTGESTPITKTIGQTVIAGSICLNGALTVKIDKTGLDSTVGQIGKLIESAKTTKPQLQHLADRVASWLTFTAVAVAIITVLVWTLIVGQSIAFALTLAVTVLVIACPHALGLAIPTVSTIATTVALRHGIFIKSLKKLEMARKINMVVFDKTGTLTQGQPAVVDIVSNNKSNDNDIINIAASLEQGSSHPLATAILKEANQRKLQLDQITNFNNLAGLGVTGKISNRTYFLGNQALAMKNKVELRDWQKKIDYLASEGKTVIILTDLHQVVGVIAIADKIRPESIDAIRQLHSNNIDVSMITGDNEGVANYVANQLKIDTYFANVLPADKYKKIQDLQASGKIVMMVGDGVNDAPALTQANVGVAIGNGTDVTLEAGDIILTRDNPSDIPKILNLSKKVYAKMVQNLIWAVGYNIIAIPTAAGVFARFDIFLRPDVGAFLMAMSSVIVVINALQLKRIKL